MADGGGTSGRDLEVAGIADPRSPTEAVHDADIRADQQVVLGQSEAGQADQAIDSGRPGRDGALEEGEGVTEELLTRRLAPEGRPLHQGHRG